MSISGIASSLSALRVTSTRVNNTAHNLANVSTTGFAPKRINQGDTAQGGVQILSTTTMPSGPMIVTDRPMDLAIDGPGYFILTDVQGNQVYTRAGNFQLDNQGRLTDSQGRLVTGPVTIPAQTSQVSVSPEGKVQAFDSQNNMIYEGQINLASFGNSGGLQALGGNIYKATPSSGPPVLNQPGAAGYGYITSGALESSGTDIAREMLNLTVDSRVFEANIKAVQTQDEMLDTLVHMKK